MSYLTECNVFIASSPPELRSRLNKAVDNKHARRLIDDLVAAVRAEQPGDNKF